MINVASARIDEQVYLLNYREYYAEALDEYMSNRRIAELFLFRAWTAQFGYRIFSSNPEISEKLIGETVNASQYLGLGIFQKLHDFSIEAELGSNFISLIDDRWSDYDQVFIESRTIGKIPAVKIVSSLARRLEIEDVKVLFLLSMDFLRQLEFVKQTAIDLGILKSDAKEDGQDHP